MAKIFKIAVVKWSKLALSDHDHGQNFKIAVVKWSKMVILTIDHGQNEGCHGHGQHFLTIDHGVNSRVSWSWSVPYPPPPPNLEPCPKFPGKTKTSIDTFLLRFACEATS